MILGPIYPPCEIARVWELHSRIHAQHVLTLWKESMRPVPTRPRPGPTSAHARAPSPQQVARALQGMRTDLALSTVEVQGEGRELVRTWKKVRRPAPPRARARAYLRQMQCCVRAIGRARARAMRSCARIQARRLCDPLRAT